ncbi:MAG: hypothetical protein AAGA15_00470 [Pseudomonadota bacterium]
MMPKITIRPLQVALFLAPALFLPAALGLASYAAWQTPGALPAFGVDGGAPMDALSMDAKEDGADNGPEAAAIERAYITFVPDIDVPLPAGMGRLKTEVAFAVEARHEAAIFDGLPQEASVTQSNLVEAALRHADEMAVAGRLTPDLAMYREELPTVLTAAINEELLRRDLPAAVLETLIMSWSASLPPSGSPERPTEPPPAPMGAPDAP